MKLLELIEILEAEAVIQGICKTVCRHDVRNINSEPSVNYPVFAWQQETHNALISDGVTKYRFNLFYVDRLDDKKENLIQVQSAGLDALRNIVSRISERYDIYSGQVSVTPFTYRFTDECGGCYADVTFEVSDDYVCGDAYQDDDFEFKTIG